LARQEAEKTRERKKSSIKKGNYIKVKKKCTRK
jgi:hypothetical protein